MHRVDDISMLSAKIDALQMALNKQTKQRTVAAVNATTACGYCGGAHEMTECMNVTETEEEIEQANTIDNNFRPQPAYNTYHPNNRNHPNLSYANNQRPAAPQQNYQQ